MTWKTKLAYWLLGTNREELRKQCRRVENEQSRSTELIQLQALLKIDHARKPEPYNVEEEHENYFDRWH